MQYLAQGRGLAAVPDCLVHFTAVTNVDEEDSEDADQVRDHEEHNEYQDGLHRLSSSYCTAEVSTQAIEGKSCSLACTTSLVVRNMGWILMNGRGGA